MADCVPGQQQHNELIQRLCRVCGEFLKKTRAKYESSYACEAFRGILEERYNLDVGKDVSEIHPSRFCNLCYISTTGSRGSVFWHVHTEENCQTCSSAQKKSKGGRPVKRKRGLGAGKTQEGIQQNTGTRRVSNEQLCEKIAQIMEQNLTPARVSPEKFSFIDMNEQFKCPICRDVLEKPVELNTCEHHFCGPCFLQLISSVGKGIVACPVCKGSVTSDEEIRTPHRVTLNLLGELRLECMGCREQVLYERHDTHVCAAIPQRAPHPNARPVPCLREATTVQQALEQIEQGDISPEVEKLGTLFVKSKLKSSEDGKTATLKTRGKSLRLVAVPKAQKPSDVISSRQMLNRTKVIQNIGKSVSGGKVGIHLAQQIKANKAECQQLLKEAFGKKAYIEVTDGQALAMKADLQLPWFQLGKLRRWFKVWGVKIESEKKQRHRKKNLIGENLESELLPLEHTEKKGNKTVTTIKPTPTAYVVDLSEKITSFLDSNSKSGLLTWHEGNIPDNKVFVKVGGDHGQGSMKLCFQLANLENPNSSKKTVVFHLYEGKDTRSNMRAVTEVYKTQLDDLILNKWQDKEIVLFLFGDYEFLCKIIGISGASGRHPCLWCTISAAEMSLPKQSRSNIQTRTLEHLTEMLQKFYEAGADIKKAKLFFNVIHAPLFNIPIEQICIPGLHISLGLFLKFFVLFENACSEMDEQIIMKLAEQDPSTSDSNTDSHLQALRIARKHEKQAVEHREEVARLTEYATFINGIAGSETVSENQAKTMVTQIFERMHELQEKAEHEEVTAASIYEKNKFSKENGRVVLAIEALLQSINVKRQAYHSHSFVGNHIDICLEPKNIVKLCQVVVKVTEETCPELLASALAIQEKYHKLFSLFSKCHFQYNSSKAMTDGDISQLERDISHLLDYIRDQFMDQTFPPKLHMLEDHVVPFIRSWGFPLGFFGEQGGESIHHEFVRLAETFSRVKPDHMRLKKMLEDHYLIVHPECRELIPVKALIPDVLLSPRA